MFEFRQEVAFGVEGCDTTEPGPVLFVRLARLSLCVCNHNIAADILNSESRPVRSANQMWIAKCPFIQVDSIESAIEHFNFSSLEICGVKIRSVLRLRDGQSFIDRLVWPIDDSYRYRWIYPRIPSGDGSIFCCEYEDSWLVGRYSN